MASAWILAVGPVRAVHGTRVTSAQDQIKNLTNTCVDAHIDRSATKIVGGAEISVGMVSQKANKRQVLPEDGNMKRRQTRKRITIPYLRRIFLKDLTRLVKPLVICRYDQRVDLSAVASILEEGEQFAFDDFRKSAHFNSPIDNGLLLSRSTASASTPISSIKCRRGLRMKSAGFL